MPSERYRAYPRLFNQEATKADAAGRQPAGVCPGDGCDRDVSFERVAAAELVDDALQSFRHRLVGVAFVWRWIMPADLPFVRADRRRRCLRWRT